MNTTTSSRAELTPCPRSGGKAWIASPSKAKPVPSTIAATRRVYCGFGNAPGFPSTNFCA
eukprot:scaffold23787_cov29-Tisochrysis_lutea.AAC.5